MNIYKYKIFPEENNSCRRYHRQLANYFNNDIECFKRRFQDARRNDKNCKTNFIPSCFYINFFYTLNLAREFYFDDDFYFMSASLFDYFQIFGNNENFNWNQLYFNRARQNQFQNEKKNENDLNSLNNSFKNDNN